MSYLCGEDFPLVDRRTLKSDCFMTDSPDRHKRPCEVIPWRMGGGNVSRLMEIDVGLSREPNARSINSPTHQHKNTALGFKLMVSLNKNTDLACLFFLPFFVVDCLRILRPVPSGCGAYV